MMLGKMGRVAVSSANLCAVIVLLLVWCSAQAPGCSGRTITDSSPLDNLIIRPLFHKFRNFTFGIVGPTSLLKRSGRFYQTPLLRFPCDKSFGRSRKSPTSVHKLRPGNGGGRYPSSLTTGVIPGGVLDNGAGGGKVQCRCLGMPNHVLCCDHAEAIIKWSSICPIVCDCGTGTTTFTFNGGGCRKNYDLDAPVPPVKQTTASSLINTSAGDIDIVAAMGDSLTAATGATSTAFMDLFIDNRGLSWSIGGQWTYRNSTTLPNILKEFNPNLFGYSTADSYPFHLASQFNVAEIGGVSADMAFMARALIQRIRSDPRTDFKRHWKMVTISIGGNDLCSFSCTWKNPESLPEKHRRNLIQALRIIRDNLPRTYVNLVSVPSIETVIGLKSKPQECKVMHHMECSCWVGPLYNKTLKYRERLARIQQQVIRVEQEVAGLDEFKNLQEFAIVHQPFTLDISMSDKRQKTDFSLLAYDCFHMSQKGNALAGVALWNNVMEPLGHKTRQWRPAIDKYPDFRCPTRESPYLFTHENSRTIV